MNLQRLLGAVASFLLPSLLLLNSALADLVTTPPSLNPGDSYRLAFVTSTTRDALSSNIADYNSFVQNVANTVPELNSLGVAWNVIGSTSTVDARDNTGTNPAVEMGVPIFLLDGTKIADDNNDLWDGTIDEPLNVIQDGTTIGFASVWTGTNLDGSASTLPLGTPLAVVLGSAFFQDNRWISNGSEPATTTLRLYALSTSLVVSVPEPSTFLPLTVVSLLTMCRRNRRV